MMKYVFWLFILVQWTYAATFVAVLETVSENGIIGRSEKIFLTDKLRERAKIVLPSNMGYIIMTRENIQQMLPPGKSIEDCEGSCLVETGKNISADYVAQARVGKFGKQLTLTVELYETAKNNLVGSFTAVKKNAEGLLYEIEKKSDAFFKLVLENGFAQNDIKPEDSKSINVLKDPRDGKTYRLVTIGAQIWMLDNLNFKTQTNSWCYEDSEHNCKEFGRLYSWNAAQKACPNGWRIATENEWNSLNDSIDKLFLKTAGFRNAKGKYELLGKRADYWTSDDFGDKGKYYYFSVNSNSMDISSYNKKGAMSVRCIKK